jgi:hypothetical protein
MSNLFYIVHCFAQMIREESTHAHVLKLGPVPRGQSDSDREATAMSRHLIRATMLDGSRYWVRQLPDGDVCFRKHKANATPCEARRIEHALMSLQHAYPDLSFGDYIVNEPRNA